VLKYAAAALRHKVAGLASYYSTSLDGTLTATGEIFRNRHFTAPTSRSARHLDRGDRASDRQDDPLPRQ